MKEYNEYFNRQIQLWGEDTQHSLKDKSILIIGSGGLGCSLGVSLGSSGIGSIDIVDFDTVGVHNIHRQIAFKVGDDGKAKCDVLKELIVARNPYVNVTTHNKSFEEFEKSYDGKKYDLILDATDNLPVRALIDKFAKCINTPWIYGSVESFHGQVCFFKDASFESVFNVSDHKPAGIAAPIVIQIASLQANMALRYLAGLSVKKDFLYYCFFNDEGEYVVQKFGLSI